MRKGLATVRRMSADNSALFGMTLADSVELNYSITFANKGVPVKWNRRKSFLGIVILVGGLVAALTMSGKPADDSGTSALYAVNAFASDNVWTAGYKYQGNQSRVALI